MNEEGEEDYYAGVAVRRGGIMDVMCVRLETAHFHFGETCTDFAPSPNN